MREIFKAETYSYRHDHFMQALREQCNIWLQMPRPSLIMYQLNWPTYCILFLDMNNDVIYNNAVGIKLLDLN